ncbi:MAG: aldolase/citrate lyase family protein [Candidatus Margulisbacteria bacterium]|nr:aldolase/citrate lyase family protein [Candidatus Margulisiibacteriota bacterium]
MHKKIISTGITGKPHKSTNKIHATAISPGLVFADKKDIFYYQVLSIQDIKLPEHLINADLGKRDDKWVEKQIQLFCKAAAAIKEKANRCPTQIGHIKQTLSDPGYIYITEERVRKKLEEERKSLPEVIKELTIDYLNEIKDLLEFQPYMKEGYYDAEALGLSLLEELGVNLFQNFMQLNLKKGQRPVLIVNRLSHDMCYLIQNNISAVIAKENSGSGHPAIMVKAMGIPMITGVDIEDLKNVENVFVDANAGNVHYNLEPKKVDMVLAEIEKFNIDKARSLHVMYKESKFLDGIPFQLAATINLMQELSYMQVTLADGIGLVRTEKILASIKQLPTFLQQKEIYRKIIDAFPEAMVRIFDVADDKPSEYIKGSGRGIDIIRQNEAFYINQLAAMISSGVKNILIPMVRDERDIRYIYRIIKQAAKELDSENEKEIFNKLESIKIHVMLETFKGTYNLKKIINELKQQMAVLHNTRPDSAEVQKLMSETCISIGWNDFSNNVCSETRYVHDKKQAKFNFLKYLLIKDLFKLIKDEGLKTSICGEIQPLREAAYMLFGLGADKISVSSAEIVDLKEGMTLMNSQKFPEFFDLLQEMEPVKELLEFINLSLGFVDGKSFIIPGITEQKAEKLIEYLGRKGVLKKNRIQHISDEKLDSIKTYLDEKYPEQKEYILMVLSLACGNPYLNFFFRLSKGLINSEKFQILLSGAGESISDLFRNRFDYLSTP